MFYRFCCVHIRKHDQSEIEVPRVVYYFFHREKYVLISETSAEIMLVKQILEFLGIKKVFPIIVRVENVGKNAKHKIQYQDLK